jgi:hypothetical protein
VVLEAVAVLLGLLAVAEVLVIHHLLLYHKEIMVVKGKLVEMLLVVEVVVHLLLVLLEQFQVMVVQVQHHPFQAAQ